MNLVLNAILVAAFVIAAVTLLALVTLRPNKKNKSAVLLENTVAQYSYLPVGNAPQPGAKENSVQSPALRPADYPRDGLLGRLATSITAAGLTIKPLEYSFICVGSAFLTCVVFFILSGASLPAGVVGLAVGACAPLLFLKIKRMRRQAKFLYDLPDALTAIASGLTAGLSLPQSLASTAEEASGPMGEELNRVMVEARLGTPIPDALEASAMRMNCIDLEMVVMAIRLQSKHGGNLAELLTTVSATLRERVQMKRHVRALSAEGRLSLWVLMALPVVVLISMSVVRPEYFEFFITTTLGYVILFVGAVLMLVGYMWAKAIVKVEV